LAHDAALELTLQRYAAVNKTNLPFDFFAINNAASYAATTGLEVFSDLNR